MNEALKMVAEAIANDIAKLAQAILEDHSIATNEKTGTNTLANSRLRETISVSADNSDDVVIHVLFANYIDFIEKGREPRRGKKPPVSVLESWAKNRGIPTDNGTLYAIAYAIWRDGYAGRPILATLETKIEQHFEEEWAEDIFNALFSSIPV